MIPSFLETDVVFSFLAHGIGILTVVILLLALVAIRLRLANEARKRQWDALEERWTPILLDVLNDIRPVRELQEAVAPSESRAFLSFLHRFAGRLRGRERARLDELAEPHLPVLLQRIGKGRAERRARDLQILATLGMPAHTGLLVDALDDDSPVVSMIAARRLFRPGQEALFDRVLRSLDRFVVWSPRYLSGMLAGGGLAAAPALRAIMIDGRRSDLERAVAVDALALLHDVDAADAALRLLRSARGRELPTSLLRLLEEVGRPEHAPEVRGLLESEDPVVRQAAAEALGALGDRETDGARLEPLLSDSSPWVRMGAATALSHLGARDRLLAAARTGGPSARVAAEVLAR